MSGQLWLFDAPAPSSSSSPPADVEEWETIELGRDCEAAEPAIVDSHSCSSLCSSGKIRQPFRFRGADWICTGSSHLGPESEFDCYRVVEPAAFSGPNEPKPYGEHDFHRDELRGRFGPYHGMKAQLGRRAIVLEGPPIVFINGRQHNDEN